MKKIKFIFAAFAFTAAIAVISCSKENTSSTSQPITSATDAVQVDNSVVEISDMIDDYQSLNMSNFNAVSAKAAVANSSSPMPILHKMMKRDTCANVTMDLTANATTGINIAFVIDFGTTGCVGTDGKTRSGKITSTYTWVALGGWSRVSTIDLKVNDVQFVGTQTSTFSLATTTNNALFTVNTALKVIVKDSLVKNWASNRQRELIFGNGGANLAKIYKVTGSSTFSNSKGASSSFTITVPLIKPVMCKIPTSGTVVTVNRAGVTTTIDYGTGTTCKDGYTITCPGDKNGKGFFTRFIKWAR